MTDSERIQAIAHTVVSEDTTLQLVLAAIGLTEHQRSVIEKAFAAAVITGWQLSLTDMLPDTAPPVVRTLQ